MRGLLRTVLAATLVAVAPIPPVLAQSGPEPCPLTPEARILVEEVVKEAALDAAWVAGNAHGLERGFALSLVGVDAGDIGSVFRIGECEKPKTFEPYCERDPETNFVRCSRLACDAAGVDTVEVSVSLGKPKLARREPLRYATTSVVGEAVYDPFPSALWRTVKTGDDRYAISAGIFRRVTVTPTGGAPIDLTHSGTISISKAGDEITSIEILLTFPLVVAGQPQVTAEVSYDESGRATGGIRQGSRTLATVSGAPDLAITWQESCGAKSAR